MESYESDVQTTRYTIETGAVLSDQATLVPKTLSLTCYVTPVNPNIDTQLHGTFRDEEAWQKILAYQRSFQLTTVVSMLGIYENMLLKSVTTSKNFNVPRGTFAGELQFEQQLIAETETTKLSKDQISTGAKRNASNIVRGDIQAQKSTGSQTESCSLKVLNYFVRIF
jgi:hypothetical protein